MWEKRLTERLKPIAEAELCLPHEAHAAVLVLLIPSQEGGQGHLLLTKRTATVETHKGQMSFPGGFRENKDKTWLETALRETQEEIGIAGHEVQILGRLEPVLTKGSVKIIPFVGALSSTYQIKLNSREVERVVLLPVEVLVRHGLKPVRAQEAQYTIQSIGIHWDGELIWGATAKMLEQLRDHFSEIVKAIS